MSRVCTFFGHRQVSEEIRPILRQTLVNLIETGKANKFFVGNQGGFDFIVRKELKSLKETYLNIDYAVVLAYMPGAKDELYDEYYSDAVFPDELTSVHPKFAIEKRNRLLVDWSDIVITYVHNSFGGAAKFKELAIKKKKEVIEICR